MGDREAEYQQWFNKLPATMRESAKKLSKERLIDIVFRDIWEREQITKALEETKEPATKYQNLIQEFASSTGLAALFSTSDQTNNDEFVNNIRKWQYSHSKIWLERAVGRQAGVKKRQSNAQDNLQRMTDAYKNFLKDKVGQRPTNKEIAKYLEENGYGKFSTLLKSISEIKKSQKRS